MTWKDQPSKITIAFQVILYNNQKISHFANRMGDGYALCMYKIEQDPKIPRESERLESHYAEICLQKPWLDLDYDNHVTSLMIIHNPASDSDSMSTSDAPMLP